MEKKNIILTGKPGVGKSTLLEKIVSILPKRHGLITREIKPQGFERIGFKMGSLSLAGNELEVAETIAHVGFSEEFPKVSRYYVNIKNIETVSSFIQKIHQSKDGRLLEKELLVIRKQISKPFEDERFSADTVLYLDEIGQMQLLSKEFKTMAREFLESENCLVATMKLDYEHPFINMIKTRDDVIIIELTENNREEVERQIKEMLQLEAVV